MTAGDTDMRLRILLVDDHEVVRLGLRALLSRYEQFEVVAEAGDAEEALAMTLAHEPDVVVMDIRLPGKSGVEATEDIMRQRPDTKVVMLTSYAEDEVLIDAIAAGASGYVLKQIGGDDLVRALITVGRGESMLDPAVTQKVFRTRAQQRKAGGRRAVLGLDRPGAGDLGPDDGRADQQGDRAAHLPEREDGAQLCQFDPGQARRDVHAPRRRCLPCAITSKSICRPERTSRRKASLLQHGGAVMPGARMGVITQLKVQKRDKDRVSVFVDGEYAFSVSMVAAANLRREQELTPGRDRGAEARGRCASGVPEGRALSGVPAAQHGGDRAVSGQEGVRRGNRCGRGVAVGATGVSGRSRLCDVLGGEPRAVSPARQAGAGL